MKSGRRQRLHGHRWGWFGAVTLLSAAAFAQHDHGEAAAVPHTEVAAEVPAAAQPSQAVHAVAEAPGQAPHAAAAEASGHQAHHAGHHDAVPPTFDDINWFYGILGETSEGEPSLLFRTKGMPVPFISTLFNWGILVYLIVMLAKKQIPGALAKRKATIVQGMEDAKKLRDESEARLREYEEKLAKIDRDIERVKDDMRRAGEQERDRILAEAVERRSRMERDARRLLETEIEAAKESLRQDIAKAALAAARDSIVKQVEAADQHRFFDEAMVSLKKLPAHKLGGLS